MPDSWNHRAPRHASITTVTGAGDLVVTTMLTVYINMNRVPSKAAGRKGTRRAYKRAHPPGWQFNFWREVTNGR